MAHKKVIIHSIFFWFCNPFVAYQSISIILVLDSLTKYIINGLIKKAFENGPYCAQALLVDNTDMDLICFILTENCWVSTLKIC